MNRADLLRYIFDVCVKLGVQYDAPAPRRLIVQGDTAAAARTDEGSNAEQASRLRHELAVESAGESLLGTNPF